MTGLKASSSRRSAARALVAVALTAALWPGAGAMRASAAPATAEAVQQLDAAPRLMAVVQPRITMRAPATVEAGRLLTVTGAARPARPGSPVQLWELRGTRWVAIAEAGQRRDGAFTIRMRAGALGRHTYRVATPDPAGSNAFRLRSAAAVVRTLRPSTRGVRSTRLSATTPLGANVGQRIPGSGPWYETGTFAIGGTPLVPGRRYPDSVRLTSLDFSYELGANAATFASAVSLAAVPGGHGYAGPRLVEIRVDGAVRVRRYLRGGQAFPVSIDVRGKRVVRIISTGEGSICCVGNGSLLVLGTPVVTSAVLSERGTVRGTPLSNLRPTAVIGPIRLDRVEGDSSRELLGGSIRLDVAAVPPPGKIIMGSVTYRLNGAYTRLVGVPSTFGESQGPAWVRVHGDGRLLTDSWVPRWSFRRSAIDVTGIRLLRIELLARTDPTGGGLGWRVVWADGRLTR